jgi:hypothetical protein
MEIANRESYYEPNPVNPVAGHYYDYQYNRSAPGPSQPIEPLESKACDFPQEYYIEVLNDLYETTPAHYTQQQYNSQMAPPVYADPGYFYYDYVPDAEKESEFDTLAYQNPSYQQKQPEQQPEQQPEHYYYYHHPQGEDNNNYNGNFPVTNPAIPTCSYSSDNLPSKSYGQCPEGPTQDQAIYYNFDPSNNYLNNNNNYYKPG